MAPGLGVASFCRMKGGRGGRSNGELLQCELRHGGGGLEGDEWRHRMGVASSLPTRGRGRRTCRLPVGLDEA
jgi:hypothetical protein